jgi:hypothetical protein
MDGTLYAESKYVVERKLTSGGTELGRGFDPEMFRIRPCRVVSWGIDTHRFSANARSVG